MRLALPILCAMLLAALPARAETTPDAAADIAAVKDCAQDLLPEESRGCIGGLTEGCFQAMPGEWTLDKALACWRREEAAWAGWGEAAYAEAKARLEPTGAETLKELQISSMRWAEYRNAACRTQRLAWPGDDNGPLLEAQCRMRKTAERTLELIWLGVP